MRSTTIAVPHSLVAGLLALCTILPSFAQTSDAAAVVDKLHAALLDIMKNAEVLGLAGRRDRIAPVIEQSLDLPFIARFTLGRHWADLSEEQQKIMVDVFSRWTIAHYAARFNAYSGQRFETSSSEPTRRGRELVRTLLKSGSDSAENVNLDYLLQKSDGTWRIVNVIANGVSDLSLKRADYGAEIKARGFDSLIGKLNAQVEVLESGN